MFESDNNFTIKTAGAFLIYKNMFAFMIGANKIGDKLGIVRLGGHVEENEKVVDCVRREIKEEASVNITIVSSPTTYYKHDWKTEEMYTIDNNIYNVNPLLIVGDKNRATALYFAYTQEQLVPASEAEGIVLLNEQNISYICNEEFSLNTLINEGCQLLQKQNFNSEKLISAGPHLRFLNELIIRDNDLVRRLLDNTK